MLEILLLFLTFYMLCVLVVHLQSQHTSKPLKSASNVFFTHVGPSKKGEFIGRTSTVQESNMQSFDISIDFSASKVMISTSHSPSCKLNPKLDMYD